MSMHDPSIAPPLGADVEAARERLALIRWKLLDELDQAPTPAVAHALKTADLHLFLALGYLGHVDEIEPGQRPATRL